MAETWLEEAAALLLTARLEGRPFERLPDHCRPHDAAEAYAVQDRLHALMAARGQGRRVGRKIGCTTEVMQRYLGIDSPCAGGLYDRSVHQAPARLRHDAFQRVGVECEIAVRLSADLPPGPERHDQQTVRAAVQCCMAAIEIVDDRYADYPSLDTPTLIADDFFNAAAVLGAAVGNWQSLDLASLEGRMTVDGKVVGEGQGAAILGHPLAALAWLANLENARGRALRAGELVLLGSIVKTEWVDPGAAVEIAIEGLGQVSVRFD